MDSIFKKVDSKKLKADSIFFKLDSKSSNLERKATTFIVLLIKNKQKKRTSAFFVCYPFLKEPKTARTKPPKNLGSLMV